MRINDETTTHLTYASRWMVEFYVYLIYMVSLWPTDKFFACYLWLCAISIFINFKLFSIDQTFESWADLSTTVPEVCSDLPANYIATGLQARNAISFVILININILSNFKSCNNNSSVEIINSSQNEYFLLNICQLWQRSEWHGHHIHTYFMSTILKANPLTHHRSEASSPSAQP